MSACKYNISSSIVLFNPDKDIFKAIDSFLKITVLKTILYLIDNSPSSKFEEENRSFIEKNKIKYIFTGKNLGYGGGHNIALKQTIDQSEYHLILNPDVYFEESAVEKIYEYAIANTGAGHIMPKVLYPGGGIQYACKLIPAPVDLIRRLLPGNFLKKRNEKFEMRFSGYDKIMQVPYMSGCFMFLKCSALKNVGLFDERFFMYPEDIDMTRRIHEHYKTIFFPNVHVYHAHAKSSFKNKKLFFIHLINMVRYFNKWGWFFDAKRRKINAAILQQFKQTTIK